MTKYRKILTVLALSMVGSAPVLRATAARFATVPEMTKPPGIEASPRHERSTMQNDVEGRRGLARFDELVRARWPEIQSIDLVALSRFHVESTREWQLPVEPGTLDGKILTGGEGGKFFLELRGPRLPARYDIVHRYLTFFARYDAASGELDRLTVTIRGWVLE